MRTNSLLGKGIAFPLRIDPITKDFAISEGNTNDATVELTYMSDAWTARETVPARQNLIAESIAHIVLTNIGEYDTLPKFGSHVINEVFEQNTYEQEVVTRVYFQTAAERWEKRVRIPEEGVTWKTSPWDIDENIAKVGVSVSFISEKKAGNLVAPYVTVEEARLQEYRAQELDDSRHDYFSRYYGAKITIKNGVKYNRLRHRQPIPYARDDYPYTIQEGDTWLYIADDHYDDNRCWWIPAKMYIQDKAKEGARLAYMNPNRKLTAGEDIRMPSKSRVLNELSVNQY
jgi:phage baseplate assembly protein W